MLGTLLHTSMHHFHSGYLTRGGCQTAFKNFAQSEILTKLFWVCCTVLADVYYISLIILPITYIFVFCSLDASITTKFIFIIFLVLQFFAKVKSLIFAKFCGSLAKISNKSFIFAKNFLQKKNNILEKISHFCSNWLTAIFFAVMDKCPKTQNVNFWKHYKMQRIIYCSRFQDMNEGWVVSDERWAMNDEECGVRVDRWGVRGDRGERLGMRG